jgi:hypothetical protein
MEQWVVYAHPRDFPNSYVARRWEIWTNNEEPVATDEIVTAPTLIGVRALLPAGLYRLERWPEDDPTIVEVYV